MALLMVGYLIGEFGVERNGPDGQFSASCPPRLTRCAQESGSSLLSGFQGKLDLKHLIKVDLAFRARELIAPNIHPFANSVIALLGAVVVQPGIGADDCCSRKLLQVVKTTKWDCVLQRDKGLAIQRTRVRATMPENSTQVTDRAGRQIIHQFLFKSQK